MVQWLCLTGKASIEGQELERIGRFTARGCIRRGADEEIATCCVALCSAIFSTKATNESGMCLSPKWHVPRLPQRTDYTVDMCKHCPTITNLFPRMMSIPGCIVTSNKSKTSICKNVSILKQSFSDIISFAVHRYCKYSAATITSFNSCAQGRMWRWRGRTAPP